MLITYIRKNKTEKSKGQPIGCVVALDKNHIGWSLCNPKDKWDRKMGLEIAKGRAKKSKINNMYKNCFFHSLEKTTLLNNAHNYIKQKIEIYFKE